MAKKTSVDIVIPVYNEELALPANLPILYHYCKISLLDYEWRIVVADNASDDQTPVICKRFSEKFPEIHYCRLSQKGRGLALVTAWKSSRADIVSYMDVDLSSNLDFFPSLLTAVENGADVAIGSRLARGARVVGRTLLREIMSRGYNMLIRILFPVSFHDAQCGFKAMKRSVFLRILPALSNRNWFFDSELLIISELAGFNVCEIPISWHDDPSSTVRVARTATEDFEGLLRLRREQPWKRVVTYVDKNA